MPSPLRAVLNKQSVSMREGALASAVQGRLLFSLIAGAFFWRRNECVLEFKVATPRGEIDPAMWAERFFTPLSWRSCPTLKELRTATRTLIIRLVMSAIYAICVRIFATTRGHATPKGISAGPAVSCAIIWAGSASVPAGADHRRLSAPEWARKRPQ
jgi:hypothetical protein